MKDKRWVVLWISGVFFITSCGQDPIVNTGKATPLGLGAVSLNGEVQPRGVYTTYHFEYGPTPSYGYSTREQSLPPKLTAYYKETWDEGRGGWSSWDQSHIHHSEGGMSGGYIEWREPAENNDFNHPGADILHLVKFLRTGLVDQWQDEGNSALGGADPDLRGARVSIWVRGLDWEPRGSELTWWLQSQSNPEVGNRQGWRRANWAYNGTLLTDQLLDGDWHQVQYRLRNNTNDWTYGGKNIGQGLRARRYEYWSIDRSLAHVNNNFFHLVAFLDVHDPPVGSLHFDEFQLTYRNESLLQLTNGGELISWPRESQGEAPNLTDGWRHGKGKMWRSSENPTGPLDFVYRFENPVTVETIQAHQNPQWPTKQVEFSTSLDGEFFTPLCELILPEQGEPNDNFAFDLETGLSIQTNFLKVRVISGYRSQYWGLGEVEVFGTGARMLPDNDFYQVNQDIWNLKPGGTVYYRLVATSEGDVIYGHAESFTLSLDRRPHVLVLKPRQVSRTLVQLVGRLSPMGLPGYYFFEYGINSDFGRRTKLSYAGTEITPRSVFANLEDLASSTTYFYRLVCINGDGSSASKTKFFKIP